MLDAATLETIAPIVIAVGVVVGLSSIVSAEFYRRSVASGEIRTSQYITGGITLVLAVLAGIAYFIAQ